MAKKTFYDRVRDIDRRLIFLFIALSVAIPLIFHLYFPETPTPMTQAVFDKIEHLPAGSRILMDFSYDPASMPEIEPMATAWVRHCLLKKHKIYAIALWPVGPQLASDTFNAAVNFLRNLDPERRIVYGEDYVNLGFKSGAQGVINVLLTNLGTLYSTDINGANIADIPMMNGVVNLKSFDLIASISAGTPGTKELIQFGSVPAGVPLVAGTTSVFAPLLYPYYPAQMLGILGGLKSAAEYDALLFRKIKPQLQARLRLAPKLLQDEIAQLTGDRSLDPAAKRKLVAEKTAALRAVEKADPATLGDRRLMDLAGPVLGYTQKGISRMGPQAVAHLVIVLFIIIGNITYFIDKRRGRR